MTMSVPSTAPSPGPRIHPTKRFAQKLSRLFPRRWRFPIFGLPPAPAASPARAEIFPAPNLSSIHRGIACHLGANLDGEGALVESLNPGLGGDLEHRFLQRQRFFPKIRKVSGTAVSLVGGAHTNYFHWLLETLPRLKFIQESNRPYEWLYACQKHSFHREGLSLLGCDPTKIIDSSRTPFLHADTVLVPRFVQAREPWVIPWLREKLVDSRPDKVRKNLPRRIYISRRKASSRKVVNETDVLELLEGAGFVSLLLEDLSWADQVALFQQAEAIAGPHGAGFANVIFSSPKTLIMELMPKEYPFHIYEQLSLGQGLDYRRVDVDLLQPTDPGASDMKVDLKSVEEILRNSAISSH